MSARIAYTKPSITGRETAYAADAACTGWGAHCYDYLERFERAFQAHLDVPHAVATSSCTGALHLGLAALGVGPGDEVILADANWIASAAPIRYVGATPVFVDILSDTWCLDPACVAAAVTPRTKAILAVHLYGNLCELDALRQIGDRHGLPVIEDAAEALGAVYHGRRAGSLGRFGVFSFHGTKTITTGEGGMFVTRDAQLYEAVVTLANHGRRRGESRQFWPERLGFKYKLSNIQAAIGCAQLERAAELFARKREIFAYYAARLDGVSGLSLNVEKPGTTNGCWMPTAVFAPETGVTRERLVAAFAAANIDARVFFHPLSSLPLFGGGPGQPVSRSIAARAINLPSYHDMTAAEQDRVVDVLRTCGDCAGREPGARGSGRAC